MEWIVIAIFAASLIFCVGAGISVVYALLIGLACFYFYARKQGNDAKTSRAMFIKGISSIRLIIVILTMIGMLTASWRAGGIIAYILHYAASLINPSYFALFAFLICTVMSILTGTSFGTAGTAGVICINMAQYMGLDPYVVGGAIISGIFVGDRCSPMSSSALLVASITKTDIWTNIRIMLKTSWVPFLLCCVAYALVGRFERISSPAASSTVDFLGQFNMSPWLLLPVIIIIGMCIMRIKIYITIGVSILCSAVICFFMQDMAVGEIVKSLIFGYYAGEGNLMNGGGALSMLEVLIIVIISSSYIGVFSKTPILQGIKDAVSKMALKLRPFTVTTILSIIISGISCNQTLATMLSHEMQKDLVEEPLKQAEYLENSVILIAALIPWGIAGAVPLAMIGAPPVTLLFAMYLYVVPIWNILMKR